MQLVQDVVIPSVSRILCGTPAGMNTRSPALITRFRPAADGGTSLTVDLGDRVALDVNRQIEQNELLKVHGLLDLDTGDHALQTGRRHTCARPPGTNGRG